MPSDQRFRRCRSGCKLSFEACLTLLSATDAIRCGRRSTPSVALTTPYGHRPETRLRPTSSTMFPAPASSSCSMPPTCPHS